MGEYDRAVLGAFGIDLATPCNDERGSVRAIPCHALDHRSRLNRQGLTAVDEHIAIEQVGVRTGPRGRADAGAAVVRNNDGRALIHRRTIALGHGPMHACHREQREKREQTLHEE